MQILFQRWPETYDAYFKSFYYFIDRSNDRDFWGEETFAEYICRSNLWGFDFLMKYKK